MPPKDPQFDLFGAAPRAPPAVRGAPLPSRNVPVAAEPVQPVPAPPAVREETEDEGPKPSAVLTVTELTTQIKGLLEGRFVRVAVGGEISNCRRQSSGHLYFTLKDAGACLGAVLWRQSASRLRFEPVDGLEVVCHGRLELYAPHGKYQLIAERMEPLGAGALALAFEQLKGKLEREGLFDPARKRPLPFLPRQIGVVTSPTGAALRDFLRVLHGRFPSLCVLVAPAKVQGEGAAAEIAAGIDRLSSGGGVDVIVVTRGGGSTEDLWAFNEEVVARAIARSRVPVVSAVGHEIDFTIADFVADWRAPTPTAAAEILAPVRTELLASAALLARRLERGLIAGVQQRRERLLRLRFRLGDPRGGLTDRRLHLSDLEERLQAARRSVLERRREALRGLRARLEAASPRADLLEKLRRLHGLRSALELSGRRSLSLSLRQAVLSALRSRLTASGQRLLQVRREALGIGRARLEAFSPQRVFERGYSLARKAHRGPIVQASTQVSPGDELEIVLSFAGEGASWTEDVVRAVVVAAGEPATEPPRAPLPRRREGGKGP